MACYIIKNCAKKGHERKWSIKKVMIEVGGVILKVIPPQTDHFLGGLLYKDTYNIVDSYKDTIPTDTPNTYT